jgi:catechol 2,3-dioxygenase-like lactoylglutathione lyase family enzyme
VIGMTQGKIDAIGLIVADLSRAVHFYRRLGAEFPEGAELSEHGHAEAQLGGGVRLLLDTESGIASFDPTWLPPIGEPRAALAVHCGSPAEVDALYAEAIEAGGRPHKEPWDAFWGQRYAQLRDPDGNGVDLYAELQGAS